MTKVSVLFPNAEAGDIYHDVDFDGRRWTVFYERLNNAGGMDTFVTESLFRAIGNVHPRTKVLFAITYWGLETEGVPKMPGYGIVTYPGGMLDGTSLFALLLASVEPQALFQWAVTSGPEGDEVVARIKAWFAALDPTSGAVSP